MAATLEMRLKKIVRTIPDFPKPGINFYDVTTIMKDAASMRDIIGAFAERYAPHKLKAIVGIDARGFVFGAALADRLGLGFVPVRKVGKLPAEVERVNYALEYGQGELEIHKDAVGKGDRVVIIDDLLATGGTAGAAAQLVGRLGATVVEFACVVELMFLNGAQKLKPLPVFSLMKYED